MLFGTVLEGKFLFEMYFAAADLVLDNSAIDRAHCDIMSASPDACLYVSILFCYLLKL